MAGSSSSSGRPAAASPRCWKALPGGQRQRAAIGRAIVRKPEELKATMIYVTHGQVVAMTLGEQIGTPL